MSSKEIDTQYTDEITCPYCGEKQGNSWEYNKWGEGEIDCDCGETYDFSVDVEVTYQTFKKQQLSDKGSE